MMKLKIISDGTTYGTKVVNAATGEPLGGIQQIDLSVSIAMGVRVAIQFVDAELELRGLEYQEHALYPKDAPTNPQGRVVPPHPAYARVGDTVTVASPDHAKPLTASDDPAALVPAAMTAEEKLLIEA